MPVVITDSAGYEGTVNEPQWSDLLAMSGGRQYGVGGPDDWAASIGGADREVRLSPGRGFGYGVRDKTTADASLVLPAAPSGSVWHLLHVHRDWQANRSQFDSIAGSSTPSVPGRDATPGEVDDQPLWLARVDAGKSQVQQLIDLRVWGGDGGAIARHDLVLQYLNRLGTNVQINGRRWRRDFSALGTPEWVSSGADAGQYNAVGGGGIIQRNDVGGAGSFTIPSLVPAGSVVRAFISCQIYCPGTAGRRGNNYGGRMTLHQGTIERGSRRWHNHGVEGVMVEPSAEFQWVTTEAMPAGTVLNFGVSNDPTAAGGVELWDVFASWSIQRP